MLIVKNLQFSSNQADILAKCQVIGQVILVEYQLDWMKIADFLSIAHFSASPISYCSYLTFLYFSMLKTLKNVLPSQQYFLRKCCTVRGGVWILITCNKKQTSKSKIWIHFLNESFSYSQKFHNQKYSIVGNECK